MYARFILGTILVLATQGSPLLIFAFLIFLRHGHLLFVLPLMERTISNILPISTIDKPPILSYSVPMDLRKTVVIVTGASDRLGRAIALSLAEKGASVLVHCHTDTVHADETVDMITNAGGSAFRVASDLTTIEGIERVITAVMDRYGRWNALINNASQFSTIGIEEITVESYMADQNLHQRAPFFLSKALYEQVRESTDRRQDACVVNITDTAVRRPVPSRPSYYLAKAGLEEQTVVLGRALAPLVRVNAVAPGAIIAASETDVPYFDRLATKVPLQHLASVADVLSALLFLLSTESITGQTIVVDGGEHLL